MSDRRALHRFALVTAGCTFLLIIAGGMVTSTQSGLSVPDWPNTYGHFMFAFPLNQMVGGIFYEHTHRMIASLVGLLTVILAVWLWRREDRRWVRILGLAALAAVIGQGVLGGITVLFLLPTLISVSHATLAQTFFLVVVSIAFVTSRWWRTAQPERESGDGRTLVRLAGLTTAAVFIQLILGAVMRHSNAGLAVPDFPLAYGQLFPSLSPGALDQYNRLLIDKGIRIAADDPVTGGQILIHMLHRVWASVVAFLVLWSSVRLILRRKILPRSIVRFGYLLPAILVLQIALGGLTVLSGKAAIITTAHVATGAALLGASLLLGLHLWKLYGAAAHLVEVSFTAREATA